MPGQSIVVSEHTKVVFVRILSSMEELSFANSYIGSVRSLLRRMKAFLKKKIKIK